MARIVQTAAEEEAAGSEDPRPGHCAGNLLVGAEGVTNPPVTVPKSILALLAVTILAVAACSSLPYTNVDTAPPCPAPTGQAPSLDCRFNGGGSGGGR
jgi:hypothetical protein